MSNANPHSITAELANIVGETKLQDWTVNQWRQIAKITLSDYWNTELYTDSEVIEDNHIITADICRSIGNEIVSGDWSDYNHISYNKEYNLQNIANCAFSFIENWLVDEVKKCKEFGGDINYQAHIDIVIAAKNMLESSGIDFEFFEEPLIRAREAIEDIRKSIVVINELDEDCDDNTLKVVAIDKDLQYILDETKFDHNHCQVIKLTDKAKISLLEKEDANAALYYDSAKGIFTNF